MNHPRILVLRLSAIGDVIRTLPAVRVLKLHYPLSYIAWIVEEPSNDLLESQPEIDEVILFPRKQWTKDLQSVKGLWRLRKEIRQFISDLKKREFDIALDFHGILKSGLLGFLSGAPKRIGFDRKSCKEGNFLFSNIRVELPRRRINRYERNLSLLNGLGIEAGKARQLMTEAFGKRLHIPPEDEKQVRAFFLQQSNWVQRPLIAFHPGTSCKWLNKRWMPDRYARLADRLVCELGATILFTWGPGESAWVETIRKEMAQASILGPRTESLTQLAEVFGRCDLYVGGDTGPMYTASFMGIPAVVIYGPTDPVLYEPLGLHKKVRKEVGCNPCRNRSCKEPTCLKAVTVDEVFQAVKEMLNERCETQSQAN
jgi:lipopolysaccharide heptosyltransferase I